MRKLMRYISHYNKASKKKNMESDQENHILISCYRPLAATFGLILPNSDNSEY